jgi:type IV secretory pathway VirB6-like protein
MPLLICILLYLILIGYGAIQGWFQLIWKEFFWVIFKLVVVAGLIFNWPFFQTVLVNLFIDGSSSLVHALTLHVFSESSSALTGSTESISQGILIEVTSVGLWVWKMASFSSPLPILLGIVLWLCGIGVILYGMIQILISKIMMTLLLASAPIVLIFAFFQSTAKIAVSWLQLLISNGLILLLVSLSLSLSFYLLHQLFDGLYQNHAQGVTILQLIPIILMSILSFCMIKRCVSAAFHMGSQLTIHREVSGVQFGFLPTALKSGLRLSK